VILATLVGAAAIYAFSVWAGVAAIYLFSLWAGAVGAH
jgi:hypothetical protein